MEIKELHPKDAGIYINLRLEALQTSPEAFGSSYEEEKDFPIERTENRLGDPNAYVFGAFIDGRLIGMVTLMSEVKLKMKHRANIYAVYVTPCHRGKGIAKQLIEKAIHKAKELKEVEQLYLTVVSTNIPAKRLYQSLGFSTYGIDKKAIKIADSYYDDDLMSYYF